MQAQHFVTHQETIFTKVGDSWMPALASTMLDLVSPMKSDETTSSWLTLQRSSSSQARQPPHSQQPAATVHIASSLQEEEEEQERFLAVSTRD